MREVHWEKTSRTKKLLRRVWEILVGTPTHMLTRYVLYLGRRPCPDREEVMTSFRSWAMVTAGRALFTGEVTAALLASRQEEYRRMDAETLKLLSDWVAHRGEQELIEVSEEALRRQLKKLGATVHM